MNPPESEILTTSGGKATRIRHAIAIRGGTSRDLPGKGDNNPRTASSAPYTKFCCCCTYLIRRAHCSYIHTRVGYRTNGFALDTASLVPRFGYKAATSYHCTGCRIPIALLVNNTLVFLRVKSAVEGGRNRQSWLQGCGDKAGLSVVFDQSRQTQPSHVVWGHATIPAVDE
ncbi:hypothetical protein V8C44DRAFT_343092 [Trichoderma aethiopicum]